ncbi:MULTISPECIES: hypothetical protein [Sinorhizobium]|uniref:hypothetical protein n=1 Tax=Sinorhizobium TaxID=28105 RepID=UPI000BE859B3|nr:MULTISPECIES: hypothetical protein [Sinorhizobium]PDT55063.1 hypothetical protein CO664_08325 [Sinorhizobium sp. NG07B]POH32105.1 hypothetical protein ATY30_11945 [Sinorhizobium americanum]
MPFNPFYRFSKSEDAMAQRAIERGVGFDRAQVSRTDLSQMVADFAAKTGVRRFDQGESGSYEGVQSFLLSRGYELRRRVHKFELKKVGTGGRAKSMDWDCVLDFVDQLRVSEGREPLRRAA